MARKSMIEPGSVLPASPGGSLVDRVITRDREQSGRTSPPSDENITSNKVSNITANITTQTANNEDAQNDDNASSGAARKAGGHPLRRAYSKPDAPEDEQTTSWKTAQELAATTAIPITLRLPDGLNDYLDELAHEHRKSKVKKQDLVCLAVQLLVERIESGDDLHELLRVGSGGGNRR